jgi:hypothetical protein
MTKFLTQEKRIRKGYEEQEEAAREARARQEALLQQSLGYLDPYQQAGAGALQRYQDIVLGGQQDLFKTSPGYQFRVSEGQKALERSAAARGNVLSGAQLKALTRFGQQTASQEYQNYLNQLALMQQQGLGAAQTAVGATGGFGQQIGQSLAQKGAAEAGEQFAPALARQQLLQGGLQAAGALGAGVFMSDKQVKENIEIVGKSESGIPIVEFNYIEGIGFNEKIRYRGVIAQDVVNIKPEAVIMDKTLGLLEVDYSKIDVKMEVVNE